MACFQNDDTGTLRQQALPPEHVLLEKDIHPLVEAIGIKWLDLGRELGDTQSVLVAVQNEKQNVAKECCIAVLVRWMERQGESATAGKLAEALINIGLRNVAERLIGSSLSGKRTLHLDIKGLDETNKSQWCFGQEGNGGKKCLIRWCTEEEYFRFHQFFRSSEAVNDLETWLDSATKENERGDNKENTINDEACISVLFPDLTKKQRTLAKSLAIDEVKQDKLSIAVRLDFYKKKFSELQELYSAAKTEAPSVAHCDTIVKQEFGESIMDGLRAIHNDLTSRVRDLESSQGDMSEEEKEQLNRLKQYQKGIEKQYVTTQRFVESILKLPPKPLYPSASEPVKGSHEAKGELAPRRNTYAGSSTEATREIVRESKLKRMKNRMLNKKPSSENISLLKATKKSTD